LAHFREINIFGEIGKMLIVILLHRPQETYPSDRSVSDSIGGLTTTSSSRRTVIESGTADSRRSRFDPSQNPAGSF
jgi:hypothetical protein